MKAAKIASVLLLGGVLLPSGFTPSQADGPAPGGRGPVNPAPFQKFKAPVSGPVRFILSEKGKQLAQQTSNPGARALLQAAGVEVPQTPPPRPSPQAVPQAAPQAAPSPGLQPPPVGRGGVIPNDPGVVPANCAATSGCVFNLETATVPLPQNEESMDFIRNGVATGTDLIVGGANDYRGFLGSFSGATGYYVNKALQTAGAALLPQFEGALPLVLDPLGAGNLAGGGEPVVAADPARNMFFMADLRFDSSTTGIGLFSTTRANLLNTAVCPNGTHTAAQAATCWPKGLVVNPLPSFSSQAYFQDKPHIAVDERATGTGAGNVYVAGVEFDFFNFFSRVWLVSCNNALTACSSPVIISGGDTATQFPHIAVRPDGNVTVSYVNFDAAADIKFVRCAVLAAPFTPPCLPPGLVYSETQPITALSAEDFRIATYPKHDHRLDGTGTETYIVWDRCKVPLFLGICPDADVVMKVSVNNGVTWSGLIGVGATGIAVNDQFFPWIKTDRSRNIVNIVYYSSAGDPTFQHRVQMVLNHINPDGVLNFNAISDTHVLTTLLNDPDGDPVLGGSFFGDYIGVAARGTGADGASRAYAGYTYNDTNKNCGGVLCPQQDNKVQELDY